VKAIGVDIGGTSVKLAVIDIEAASVISRSSFPTDASSTQPDPAQRLALRISERIKPWIEEYKIDLVGVGVPGAMNEDRSLVRYPPNLPGWKEEPLRDLLLANLPAGVRVEVDNDANVATVAEAMLGAARGIDNFLLATLGTGVGGGLWLNGHLYRGTSGGAGEFGHLSIDIDGPRCGCGSRGCIEAYLGQAYFSRAVESEIDRGADTILKYAARPLEPKTIAEAAEHGDSFAEQQLATAGKRLGFAFSSVAKLLDLHTFVLGGGVAQAGDYILEPARGMLREHVLENQREHAQILAAHFSNDAGVMGAAMLAVSESSQENEVSLG
jgi:glucokinase